MIRAASLCGGAIDDAFRNVNATTMYNDVSFRATMRALLLRRVKEEELAFADIEGVGMRGYNPENLEPGVIVNTCTNVFSFTDNMIAIASIACDTGCGDAFLEKLSGEGGFTSVNPGFKEMPDLAKFVQKRMGARFFINEEEKVTFIAVTDLNIRKYHYLQSFIPRYLPWLFKENPLQEDEIALLTSLTGRMSEDYERLIEQFADKYDVRGLTIQRLVGKFQKNARESQLNAERRKFDEITRRINDTVNQLTSLAQTKDDINIRIFGLMRAEDELSDDDELVEYMRANRNVTPVVVEGATMAIVVKTYIDSFDPEAYDKMRTRSGSHMFTGYSIDNQVFRDVSNRRMLMDALFSDDPKLRIKTCAYYELTVGGNVQTRRMYSYPADCKDCVPNPHINHHACLGNHQRYIYDCLQNGDIVGAIEQCVSSAKSVNLLEGLTVTRFLSDIFSSNVGNVIELPDHTSVTPEEALTWLKEQDKSKKEEG